MCRFLEDCLGSMNQPLAMEEPFPLFLEEIEYLTKPIASSTSNDTTAVNLVVPELIAILVWGLCSGCLVVLCPRSVRIFAWNDHHNFSGLEQVQKHPVLRPQEWAHLPGIQRHQF